MEEVYTEALGSETGKYSKTRRSILRNTTLNPKVEDWVPPVVCNPVNKSDFLHCIMC